MRAVVTPIRPSRRRKRRLSSSQLRFAALVALLGLAVAVLAATLARGMLTTPTRSVIVARVPIPQGASVTADELTTRSIVVPSWLAHALPSRPPIGARARTAIAPGELIESSMIARGQASRALPTVAVLIPSDAATTTMVAPGNLVDIVATITSPTGTATSELLGTRLRVLASTSTNSGYLVTVAVPSYLTALALAQASATAKLAVINATSTRLRPSTFAYPLAPGVPRG